MLLSAAGFAEERQGEAEQQKLPVVLTGRERLGEETRKRSAWFGERPANSTFEALRLSRSADMLHRRSAEQ